MLLILSAISISPAAQGQEADDPRMEAYREKTRVVRRCDRSGGAIVVCGSRAERNAKERLPLPRESVEGARSTGDMPRASGAPVRQGACGVAGGQGAGCVGGLNVIKVIDMLAKGATAIFDPDADLAPPPPLPDRVNPAGRP